jgi:uncharacterized HAD superfamily protein
VSGVIVGVDFNGVITKMPLCLDFIIKWNWDRIWNYFLGTKIGHWIHWHQKPTWVKQLLLQLKKKGDRIVVITATWNRHKELIVGWLEKFSVPFDKVVLNTEKTAVVDFKVQAFLEEKCDVFLEDRAFLARMMAQQLPFSVIVQPLGNIQAISKRKEVIALIQKFWREFGQKPIKRKEERQV